MNYKEINTNKLNYIIYCRKSSEGEDKQVQSLETQLRELQEHATKYNLNIVETITESKSAHSIGREGFKRMMELIRTGKANAILVIRANRISRNPIDAGYTISLMDEKKLLYIKTPHSTCYTCSSTDKMMIALELIFSKKDSDDKGDMVKEGQKTKALKGLPHGVATLGFLNDKSEEKGNRKWYVDEKRLPLIKELLDMYLTGTYSAGKLYKYATEVLKLTTVNRKKTGGELIVQSRIYTILTDTIYAGFFYYGSERYELDTNLPRLITEAQHNKIKMLLSGRNIPKVQHHETTYSGFISSEIGEFVGQNVIHQVICDCKKKFAYRSKTNCPACNVAIDHMENPKYLSYTGYYNVSKKKSKQPYKTLQEPVITKELIDLFSNHLQFSSDILDWSKKYISEIKDNETSKKVLISKHKDERKQELVDKKAKVRAMFRDGKINQDEYKEDISRLEIEYKDTDEKNVANIDWYGRAMEIINLSSCFVDVMQSDDIKSKRKIISALGSNLIWDDKKLLINNTPEINCIIETVKSLKSEYPKFEPKNYVVNKGLERKNRSFEPAFSKMLCD